MTLEALPKTSNVSTKKDQKNGHLISPQLKDLYFLSRPQLSELFPHPLTPQFEKERYNLFNSSPVTKIIRQVRDSLYYKKPKNKFDQELIQRQIAISNHKLIRRELLFMIINDPQEIINYELKLQNFIESGLDNSFCPQISK